MRFHATAAPHLDEIHLMLSERRADGRTSVVSAITWSDVTPGEIAPATPMRLKKGEAQVLMDELYSLGFRPTDAAGTVGHIKAMQNHLDDMRRLVFKERKPDEPAATAHDW